MHNGSPKRGGEKGAERIFQRKIGKNLLNSVRNNLHIQEVQQTTRIKSK